MEVSSFSSVAIERMVVGSVLEAVVTETLLAAQRSVASLLIVHLTIRKQDYIIFFQTACGIEIFPLSKSNTGIMLKNADALPELIGTDKRFPFEELHKMDKAGPENKDGSDTEDDDEDDDGDADDPDDDDADDEDFSGEEGGDDDEEGDPEEDPAANGNEGSDDEDEDGDDDDEDGDEDDEEEEEEEEEDEDQPPAKKKK